MIRNSSENLSQQRLRIIILLVPIFTIILLARLFYWQIIRGPELKTKASKQHQTTSYLEARRGDILDSDGNVLAGTKNVYHLFVYMPQLEITKTDLVEKITSSLTKSEEATNEAEIKDYIAKRLSLDSNWISIKHYLSSEEKDRLASQKIAGIGFEDEYIRYYPESSMSAHILGFVGQDAAGQEQGYFGLEGFYDRQLKGRGGKVRSEKDARGNPILIGDYSFLHAIEGKPIQTTIDKKVQYITENLIKEGIEKYQAIAGTAIVMESKTGKIRAMVSFPNYDPGNFSKFDSLYYKNPNVANLFEPGSIFKPLIMAAAINESLVTPDTICDICAGPVTIGKYSIKTWNDEYNANSTMTDVIVHSDNTGMVFAARKLGPEKMSEYLKAYGLGKKSGIEIQEEVSGVVREPKDFGEIDLATNSFGQGIAVTPIQMIAAINTIANSGVYMKPTLTEKEVETGKTVLSSSAALEMTKIMIKAVDAGEAKRAKPAGLIVAGKTGTAQIPIEGHYDPTKTIASFVGFFPADNPKYTMIVSLNEPQTSQWGSETAAPLWFNIAKQLLL